MRETLEERNLKDSKYIHPGFFVKFNVAICFFSTLFKKENMLNLYGCPTRAHFVPKPQCPHVLYNYKLHSLKPIISPVKANCVQNKRFRRVDQFYQLYNYYYYLFKTIYFLFTYTAWGGGIFVNTTFLNIINTKCSFYIE